MFQKDPELGMDFHEIQVLNLMLTDNFHLCTAFGITFNSVLKVATFQNLRVIRETTSWLG